VAVIGRHPHRKIVFIATENIYRYHFIMSENPWQNRWSSDQIRAMLSEQFEAFWHLEPGIERRQMPALLRAAEAPHAVIVSGLRRVGKSTLLAQFAHRLGRDSFYYLNFEDERFLGFEADDANDLWRYLLELFGERGVFIVDEIQNVPGWERFVRRLMDRGLKFYITGSNASLLSRDLGTRLTGRYIPIELFPFDFSEFLRFRGHDVPDLAGMTTEASARLRTQLDEYLRLGGIPDPLKYPELALRQTLYDDVLYRDIAARHRISQVAALRELAHFLMSNPASRISYNKLKQRLGLGSVNTVKSYIDYLRDSWLLFTTNVYDFSVKRQQVAPKKVYAIDTGLADTVGFSFSPNTGRLLENIVFLTLRRRTSQIYYFAAPGGTEVDFYLPDERRLIQVAQRIDEPATRKRELRALAEAMRQLGLNEGLLLTDRNADLIRVDGGTIRVRSIAEWLLEG
jgi:predicted AAA+ superfamily ATPase